MTASVVVLSRDPAGAGAAAALEDAARALGVLHPGAGSPPTHVLAVDGPAIAPAVTLARRHGARAVGLAPGRAAGLVALGDLLGLPGRPVPVLPPDAFAATTPATPEPHVHAAGRPVAELLAAMAARRPCIVARAETLGGLLRHDDTCLLVDPAGAEQAAAGLRAAPPTAARIAEGGARVAELFSPLGLLLAALAADDLTPAPPLSQDVPSALAPVRPGRAPRTALPDDAVTVAVPIYDAYEDLVRCIDSVIAATDGPYRLLLCDDASPDPRVLEHLRAVEDAHGHVEVLAAPQNRGFTATINAACRRVAGDVVLLNSDTVVSEGWLASLRSVALSGPRVASVTPVSNGAGAFNVPEVNENWELPPGTSPADVAAFVRRASRKVRPSAPTGNGFCLYVRREALDTVGDFDEEAFPRGYGEENDWSRRAAAAGFRHLIDDATFVYHRRTASFGAAKEALVASALDVIRARYPDWQDLVRAFLADPALDDLRRTVAGARERGSFAPPPRPRLLFVMQAGGGGAPQTNADLMASIANQYAPLLLECAVDEWRLRDMDAGGEVVDVLPFDGYWDPAAPLGVQQRRWVTAVCTRYDVALVHVRSLLANGAELLTSVKALGLPLVVSFHDFYVVCPTIKLVDAEGRYCAGHCTPGDRDCSLSASWFRVKLPGPVRHGYVHDWRAQLQGPLAEADVCITTSAHARDVISDHFPALAERFEVIPHGRDPDGPTWTATAPAPGERVRVAAYGLLGPAKGTGLLTQLLERNRAAGEPFEFHFLGDLHGSFHPEELGGVVHGPYDRADLLATFRDLGIHFGLITSLQPETYCHTLTEAWQYGMPAFATSLAALAERIGETGGGWLLDPADPDGWFATMLQVARDPDAWRRARAEIERADLPSVDRMALAYRGVYERLLGRTAVAAGG